MRAFRLRSWACALLLAALCIFGVSSAHAQRPAPPPTTATPLVPWAGSSTRRADAMILRALRRAFPRALVRHDEENPQLELDFGEAGSLPAVRAVAIEARGGPAGIAAIAVFRIARPPARRTPDMEEYEHVDSSCPDLWFARLSIPTGARAATIDTAALLEPDVCFSEYNTNDDDHTLLRVIVDPTTRGLEGPYRIRVIGAPIFHAQQCGCGGVTAAFQAFLRVDGGAPLRVDTHEEQAGCRPVLDGWVAFNDQDHDGARDLVVRQRWTSPFDPDGELCPSPRRVATQVEVGDGFDAERPACVYYVERSFRPWNAESQQYGPPQPLPLGNEPESPVAIRRRTADRPDAGAPTRAR
jgi:hypothetical protein